MIVEICTTTVAGALMAQKAGADRIELCSALESGGLTPSFGLISAVIEHVDLPVHVLIRPHVGGFVIGHEELDLMVRDIDMACSLGAAGVVVGALTPSFGIDHIAMAQMIAAAKGKWVTYHRAFDWVKNPIEGLEILEELGVHALLSSGQQPSALQGMALLKTLLDRKTSALQIMPGGGINAANASMFDAAGFKAIHASASVLNATINAAVSVSLQEHLEQGVVRSTSLEKIQQLIKAVND